MKLGRKAPYPHKRLCRDRLEDRIKEEEEPRRQRAALRGEPQSREPASSTRDAPSQSLAGDLVDGDSTVRRDSPETDDRGVDGDSTARRDSPDITDRESAPSADSTWGSTPDLCLRG